MGCSNELINHMVDLTSNFGQNLKRAFHNNGLRLQQKSNNCPKSLEDVFLDENLTKIQLCNLKFRTIPDFRIVRMMVNLPMLCLNMDLNLGNLEVAGCYEANSVPLLDLLPVCHQGNILVHFANVKCTGRIGLLLADDDCLIPQNYDIEYHLSEVAIRVSYFIDSRSKAESERRFTDIESTPLGRAVWLQVVEVLANLLHEQLTVAVAEFSISEILHDKCDEFRKFTLKRGSMANRLLDEVLCIAKDHVVVEQRSVVEGGELSAVFCKRSAAGALRWGSFSVFNVTAGDLSTLTRCGDCSLFQDDEGRRVLCGLVTIGHFKIDCAYKAHFDTAMAEGSVKAAMVENRIFVRFTIEQDNTIVLDRLQMMTVGRTVAVLARLGALSWLSTELETWISGHLRGEVCRRLLKKIREALFHAQCTVDTTMIKQLIEL